MNTAPATYAIRVDGHLDDHWSAWLGAPDMSRNDDGSTTLTVPVADQARLHGVLTALRDIGAVLTDLRVTAAPVRRSVLDRPLHTDRLTLRAGTAADVAATWHIRRLEPVNRWLIGCPTDLDGYRTWFAEPTRLASTVIVTAGHHPAAPIIGDVLLRRQDALAQVEVADQARGTEAELDWVFDPSSTDYATEAVRELVRHCFTDLHVRRVLATCFLDDDARWRLMEQLGMRRERHAVRAGRHRSGRWLDTVGYTLLRDEWS